MTSSRLLIGIALCISVSFVWAQEFYRYKDAEGRTILDTKIPGQFVNNGYDVLDSGGRLIERVPPVVVPDAAAQEESSLAMDTAQSDQILLTSYSTIEEIESHRIRKVQSLEREINIIETDQRVMQIEVEKAVQEKADYEAREFDVPPETLARIEELDLTMQRLDEQLLRRQQEIVATEIEFDGKISRFRQLKAELQQN